MVTPSERTDPSARNNSLNPADRVALHARENTSLTFNLNQPYLLLRMRFVKTVLLAAIVVALGTYAIDCSDIVSAEQAMQCCKTMPCSPHNHGKNCCETMPSTHSPFVQSASVNKITVSSLAHSVLPALSTHPPKRLGADLIVVQYHAPPTLLQTSSSSPLRI